MRDTENNSSSPVRPILAVIGAAGLSFLAFGVLWIGTPWRYQALMGVPFFLLSYGLVRNATAEQQRQILMLLFAGALPLGSLMTRFRDAHDSHLKPIIIVCAWAAGILAGWYWGTKPRP